MVDGGTASEAGERWIAPTLHVVLTPAGLAIPAMDVHPSIPLVPAALALLEHLAGDEPRDMAALEELARRHGAQPGDLEGFLASLDQRGLLTTTPSAHSPAAGFRLDAVGVTAVAPVDVEADDTLLVMSATWVLRPVPGGFAAFDHEGAVSCVLRTSDLVVANAFRLPAARPDGDALQALLAQARLGADGFDEAVGRLLALGVLEVYRPDDVYAHGNPDAEVAKLQEAMRRRFRVLHAHDRMAADVEDAADRRVRVVPVVDDTLLWSTPPLALGMLVAYAKAHRSGALEDRFLFHPRWIWNKEKLAELGAEPAVFLFSNYVWCHRVNLELSAFVKACNPAHITVHGGPDTPAYEGDNERYFGMHPHVDITVRGEGEATFVELLEALDGRIGTGEALAGLHDVAGLSFRDGDRVVRTGDRDRITDLDSLPSPYLTGLFDGFATGATSMIMETNRGCPYGCTFCDWGSATLSRIRKFDLDRVLDELAWAADNGVGAVYAADANFGIFERDVEIAARVAELKRQTGFPRDFTSNYAKNTIKHLRPIIETLADAGILTVGKVSLQSMDTETLLTIKRSNIKLDKYDALAAEFRQAELPLHVELMMGLPGSTVASTANDLQECIDRFLPAYVYPTVVLPNSPMNAPSYREQHGIVATPGEFVRQTATFSELDYARMERLRSLFLLLDKYGVLRQVGLFVHQEAGVRQIDLYARLYDDSADNPDRWPNLHYVLASATDMMAPPGSWAFFLDDVRRHLVESGIVAPSSALDTVLAVQHALLPAHGRSFPVTLELAHDYAAWHRAIAEATGSHGTAAGLAAVPRLASYGPGSFTVDDPIQICRVGLGRNMEALEFSFVSWDLDSPVKRSSTMEASVATRTQPTAAPA